MLLLLNTISMYIEYKFKWSSEWTKCYMSNRSKCTYIHQPTKQLMNNFHVGYKKLLMNKNTSAILLMGVSNRFRLMVSLNTNMMWVINQVYLPKGWRKELAKSGGSRQINHILQWKSCKCPGYSQLCSLLEESCRW